METMYPRCAGLDIHKATVVACVRRSSAAGRAHEAVRTFGTMTADLLALSDWLAEAGVTHVASWAGTCPGNDQSAGKHRSGRTTKGDRWLRQKLTQAAWAASHTMGTYLSAQYHRLADRRGKKRAVVALGHTLLTIVYHVLKRQTT